MKKKLLSVILAATMVAGLLSGCGKKEAPNTNEPDKQNEVTQAPTDEGNKDGDATDETPDANQYGDTGGLTLPLVDKPTTITWMLPSDVQDLSNKDVIKEIERRTGITLDIQAFPKASYQDKLQIVLGSGNLPDIITGSVLSEVNNLGGQGAFAAISDYLDMLPNFRALYSENPENSWVMQSYSDADGKLFTWPIYGLSRDVNHGFLYRKDILDQNGINEWTNVDEFYEVLKQLKEIYPSSIPYVSKNQDAIFKDWAYGWGIGAANADYPLFYDEADSTWKMVTTSPKFKEMLDFMKKLYSEGLLDPEFITDTAASWTAKMTEENTSFVTFDWIGRLDGFHDQVKEVLPNYDLRYANPVGPTGNIRTLPKVSVFGLAVAQNKNSEIALKLLDYLASPSGSELITLGIEGEHYTIGADGKATYPNITDVEKVDITILEDRYGAWVESMYVRVDPRSTYFAYTEKEQESQDKINNGSHYEALDPILKFTNEEIAQIAELKATLQKAGLEFATQYVLEANFSDAQWEEWLATAQRGGAADLEAVYNAAQARFNGN